MVRLRSSFKRGSLFLRKHRKWPHSPYKSQWHQIFHQQQAMHSLKQASISPPRTADNSPPYLLSSLVNSFAIYNCEPTPQAYHFLFKTVTKTCQLHQIPLILDHLEKVEKFETPQFILASLIEFYGNFGDMQNAIHLFYRTPNFRCVPSVYLLNTLLSVLCRTNEGLNFVPEVLLKSQDMNIRMEESSFRLLINALCSINKVGYAVEMFNCMINDGFSVDSKICSLLLSSLCYQADISSSEVMRFLGELRKFGFCPGIKDYSKVINFLVRRGMGMEALNVLNQMKLDGIKPDIVCYTTVLNGVIANGVYSKADELFDELLVFGLVPDVYTYNVYIYGLCKQNNVEAGIEMVTSMEELGCKPNLITYNILLEDLCKNGEDSRARDLVRDMGSKGIGLGMQTYKVMIHGLTSGGKIVKACSLLEEALDKGLCPRGLRFDEVIYGLCQTGSICKALELLEKVVNKNVSPGVRVWETLLLKSNINFVEDTFIDLVWVWETHPHCQNK
ncbi:pentatricopeptide repeat-containing protein At2g38420, mitochondrial [Ricinus communis]|nr:pentatricopeptide repeat-containing protein At2g38420, mitochondrial [Ricinus communis]